MFGTTLVIVILSIFLGSSTGFSGMDPWKKLAFVRRCSVYDFSGNLTRAFPGIRCIFFDDGRLLSGGPKSLRMFGPLGEMQWEIRRHFHHHMSLTKDKKYVLALSSTPSRSDPEKRMDLILKIDLLGKIVAEKNAESLFADVGVSFGKWPSPKGVGRFKSEGSHFNSIYEVAEEISSEPFVAGSIVVNTLRGGVFVLSPDLKRIFKHWIFPHSDNHSVHDVQVTEDGQLFYFNNKNKEDEKGIYSSIEIWNPRNRKLSFKYTAQPKQFFYSPVTGSVQMLDKNLVLFSDHLGGVFIINRKTKELIMSSKVRYEELGFNRPNKPSVQDIKAMDLTQFLQNWKGP